MTDEDEADNKLVEAFEAHIKNFIQTGSPAVFGRLEGMKEAAQILGKTEELKTFQALLKDYGPQMSKHTK